MNVDFFFVSRNFALEVSLFLLEFNYMGVLIIDLLLLELDLLLGLLSF